MVDSHYYVYSTKKFYEKNEERLLKLAKLIHPFSIIYGFDENHEK